jgi:hypothetical protein
MAGRRKQRSENVAKNEQFLWIALWSQNSSGLARRCGLGQNHACVGTWPDMSHFFGFLLEMSLFWDRCMVLYMRYNKLIINMLYL